MTSGKRSKSSGVSGNLSGHAEPDKSVTSVEPAKRAEVVEQDNEKAVTLKDFERVVSKYEHYSGPLPHPDIMGGYKQINKAFPERIMEMCEKQSAHRIEMEREIVRGRIKQTLNYGVHAYCN